MTLEQIEAFLAVNETGTFSRAAEKLHVTDSAVSHRISEFEKELGFALFKRGKGLKRVSLTKEGLSFMPLAEEWRRLWQGAINISKAEAVDEVRIIVAHSIYSAFLAEVVERYSARKLPVRLFLSATNSADSFDEVEQCRADFAIINTVRESARVTSELVAREEVVFVSGPNSPYGLQVRVEDLEESDEIYMLWNRMTGLWRERWFSGHNRSTVRIENTTLLPALLTEGSRRWALAPLSVARTLAQDNGLKVSELDHPAPSREIWLVAPRGVDELYHRCLLEDLRSSLEGREGIELVGA